MAFIEVADINNWLESTKLTVASVDASMESLFKARVFGRLRDRFDVSLWVDVASTPDLIQQLIGMLYAAAEYRKVYSEDLEEGIGLNWAEWLETTVENYLAELLDGTLSLEDAVITDTGLQQPAFYPNDASSIDDPAKFSMTAEF